MFNKTLLASPKGREVLEDRVKALEDRLEIVEAGQVSFFRATKEWADGITKHIDDQVSGVIKVSLGNIQTMKNIVNDLQEHFESHGKRKPNKYTIK